MEAIAAITVSGIGPIICHARLCRSCTFMMASYDAAPSAAARASRYSTHLNHWLFRGPIVAAPCREACAVWIRAADPIVKSGYECSGSVLQRMVSRSEHIEKVAPEGGACPENVAWH